MDDRHDTAIFGAGCFWGVEEAFRRIEGVVDATVGYAGGHTANPSYREVCTGRTGHAEVVRVVFDPSLVSYRALLEAFWSLHDPTQVNRQGPDVGSQYRSLILVGSPEQRRRPWSRGPRSSRAGSSLGLSPPRSSRPVRFFPAEEEHQRYLEKRGAWSCHTR